MVHTNTFTSMMCVDMFPQLISADKKFSTRLTTAHARINLHEGVGVTRYTLSSAVCVCPCDVLTVTFCNVIDIVFLVHHRLCGEKNSRYPILDMLLCYTMCMIKISFKN